MPFASTPTQKDCRVDGAERFPGLLNGTAVVFAPGSLHQVLGAMEFVTLVHFTAIGGVGAAAAVVVFVVIG